MLWENLTYPCAVLAADHAAFDKMKLNVSTQARLLWQTIRSHDTLAMKCVRHADGQIKAWRAHDELKLAVLTAFKPLCRNEYEDLVICPLLESLGLLQEW